TTLAGLADDKDTANNKTGDLTTTSSNTIDKYISFFSPGQNEQGQVVYPASIGNVQIKDTAQVRIYLNELKANFPFDVQWAY
ncbi:MAG TPA: hypothetical protein PK977_15985, partial [Chitinophagaceae bacterium]|nr:hypothetical protein [Chitinophagaceae bacterium]